MNEINFLPESYLQAQKRRGRLLRQVALVASVAGCLIVATVGLKANSASQRNHAERLEETVRAEQGALTVFSGLEDEHASLTKRVELQRRLEPPVTYHQIVTELSQALPAEVAVTEVVMRSVRPAPEPIETDAQREARLKREEDREKAAKIEPHLVGIEIQGLASDDLAVATLVSTLDGHPLFSRVTMRSSRAVSRNGLQAREFSLTTTVDLDRKFRWIEADQEVAHAD